jgi:hypothetical protein
MILPGGKQRCSGDCHYLALEVGAGDHLLFCFISPLDRRSSNPDPYFTLCVLWKLLSEARSTRPHYQKKTRKHLSLCPALNLLSSLGLFPPRCHAGLLLPWIEWGQSRTQSQGISPFKDPKPHRSQSLTLLPLLGTFHSIRFLFRFLFSKIPWFNLKHLVHSPSMSLWICSV